MPERERRERDAGLTQTEMEALARKAVRGWTLYLCLGPWATPHLIRPPGAYGVCLGWVSVALLTFDLEVWSEMAGEYMRRAQARPAFPAPPTDTEESPVPTTDPRPVPQRRGYARRKSWDALFYRIARFQERTFPDATAESCAAHLLEEVKEVIANPASGEEWADCLKLVLAGARLAGHDLYSETERKLEINEARKWEPTDNGYWKHRKGDDNA